MAIIHVIGQPASGKTTLGKSLASALGWEFASIDEERLALLRPRRYWPDDDSVAWERLLAKATGRVVVETAGHQHIASSLVIRCEAPDAIRRARLAARQRTGYRLAQHNRHYVQRLMAVPPPTIQAELVWDGSSPAPIGPLLDLVRSHLE